MAIAGNKTRSAYNLLFIELRTASELRHLGLKTHTQRNALCSPVTNNEMNAIDKSEIVFIYITNESDELN